MRSKSLLIFFLILSCTSAPKSSPEKTGSNSPVKAETTLPPSPARVTTPVSTKTPFQQGLLNSYDVWEFLSDHPDQNAVNETIGAPDSVWVDDNNTIRIWYYYIPAIKDYNSIEFDPATGKSTGFEWD